MLYLYFVSFIGFPIKYDDDDDDGADWNRFSLSCSRNGNKTISDLVHH